MAMGVCATSMTGIVDRRRLTDIMHRLGSKAGAGNGRIEC